MPKTENRGTRQQTTNNSLELELAIPASSDATSTVSFRSKNPAKQTARIAKDTKIPASKDRRDMNTILYYSLMIFPECG
jgi:hypothetical protein